MKFILNQFEVELDDKYVEKEIDIKCSVCGASFIEYIKNEIENSLNPDKSFTVAPLDIQYFEKENRIKCECKRCGNKTRFMIIGRE